jgi:co-chaperonin GroES (HSP10)
MAEQHRYKFTKEQVDSVDLVHNSNKVLIKIEERNIEKKTDSGIIMVAQTDTDYNPAVHSDRYGVVYAVPPSLRFDKSPLGMMWKTEVELRVGDEVWFDYINSENCVVLECDDGNDYKMIDYENIYVAKVDGQLLPINGYCLFTDYLFKAESRFDPKDGEVDKRYGYVEHLAHPIEEYQTQTFKDGIVLEEGQKVMFGHRAQHYYIEEQRYMGLDKMFRPVQRRNVAAIMDGDIIEELADGMIMVEPNLEKILPSGIIVPTFRKDIPHFKSKVVKSNNPEVEEGEWVLCPKHSPLKYVEEDVEYFLLTSEDIWFIWEE